MEGFLGDGSVPGDQISAAEWNYVRRQVMRISARMRDSGVSLGGAEADISDHQTDRKFVEINEVLDPDDTTNNPTKATHKATELVYSHTNSWWTDDGRDNIHIDASALGLDYAVNDRLWVIFHQGRGLFIPNDAVASGGGGGAALCASLNSYWAFEENVDDPVDSTPFERNLNAQGARDRTTGIIGVCRELNGVDQYFHHTAYPHERIHFNGGTVAGWVRLETFPTSPVASIVALKDGSDLAWQVYAKSVGGVPGIYFTVDASVAEGTLGITAATDANIAINTWVFFAAWADRSSNKIFLRVNETELRGDLAAQYFPSLNAGGTQFTIGAEGDGSHKMTGRVDEFSLWGCNLGSGSLNTLYNDGVGITYPFGDDCCSHKIHAPEIKFGIAPLGGISAGGSAECTERQFDSTGAATTTDRKFTCRNDFSAAVTGLAKIICVKEPTSGLWFVASEDCP